MTTIPSYTAIRDSILDDLNTEFSITIPIIGKAFLYVLACVMAAKQKLQYTALAKVQRNIFPDQAETEARGGTLERFGRVKIARDPYPARQGEYIVTIIATATGTIPAGTLFVSSEYVPNPGKLFTIENDFVISGFVPASYDIPVVANEAGIESKLFPGDNVEFTAPLAIAETLAFVSSETVAPLAAEDIEEYRQKVLQSFRLEAQGGAASDYILWGSEVTGVYKIYPYAVSGESGMVRVYVEATKTASTDSRGTPPGSMILDVEDHIELDPDTTKPLSERGRRPLGTILDMEAIVLVPVDVKIYNYNDRTATTDAILIAAINEITDATRPFIAGADDPATRRDVISRASVIQAVMNALPYSVFDDITIDVGGVLTTSYQFDNGRIPYAAAIIFI